MGVGEDIGQIPYPRVSCQVRHTEERHVKERKDSLNTYIILVLFTVRNNVGKKKVRQENGHETFPSDGIFNKNTNTLIIMKIPQAL